MMWDILFFVNSLLLGVGLAMDAFTVSLANGLSEPEMRSRRICLIAGVFAIFQALMPMIGWACVHTIVMYFRTFETLVPWIALILLVFIGARMLLEGIRNRHDGAKDTKLGSGTLILQGIATSIDALSVGFAIAEYDPAHASVCAVVIAAVTFAICVAGLFIGKRFGTKMAGYATILGGIILIIIGAEIFITGIMK